MKLFTRAKDFFTGTVLALIGLTAAGQAAIYYGWNPNTGLEVMHGAVISGGTLPVLTGCGTITNLVGGAFAGQFNTSGTSCTVTITLPAAAPNGWQCGVQDVTTTTNRFNQSAVTTTSCSATATTVAGDLITWRVTGY